ncbi:MULTISPECIES: OmpA family protein [Streptomyces]|uniref:OmpA family protein n=1 Tax=Streptomyces TaxID=1883 RepID=UPI001D15719E|nr:MULTISPECIES: OmpA family protein [Streptomyces]MCC3651991.1 OmpA family protein [Streptomyces sp. S07_1.15]WSQ73291.1 OmpA family protein [Streptomyces xinghaiensis]
MTSTRPHPRPLPRALTAPTAVVLALALSALGVHTAGGARADEGPGAPGGPGSAITPSPPVEIDADDPDLKMVAGAQLADAKVLDIKSVVEDLGGEERREDTNADVTFALQAEVLFGRDSAKLDGKANARIATIAEEIKKQDAKRVQVFGFTDNLGSSAHGDVLSKKRANAVHKQLAKDLDSGVAFDIRGYGEQFPIADNSTEEGRKKNRRVEVSFPRTDSSAD